jgi:hypothetical protein
LDEQLYLLFHDYGLFMWKINHSPSNLCLLDFYYLIQSFNLTNYFLSNSFIILFYFKI